MYEKDPAATLDSTVIFDALRSSNEFEGAFDARAHRDAFEAWSHLRAVGLSEESFLRAHEKLMQSRTTLEAGEMGIYRVRPVFVGDRLMPPAPIVPELTRFVLAHANVLPSESIADAIAKVHPFSDGNGRMARIVLYHLNTVRNEPLPLMSGLNGLRIQARFVDWLSKHYPACSEQGEPRDSDLAGQWPWRQIISEELKT